MTPWMLSKILSLLFFDGSTFFVTRLLPPRSLRLVLALLVIAELVLPFTELKMELFSVMGMTFMLDECLLFTLLGIVMGLIFRPAPQPGDETDL